MGHNHSWARGSAIAAASSAALVALGLAAYAWGLRHGPAGAMAAPVGAAVVGAFLAAVGVTHLATRTALAWRPRHTNAEVGLTCGVFYVLLVAWLAAYAPAAERVGDGPLALMGLLAVAWLVGSVARLAAPLVREGPHR